MEQILVLMERSLKWSPKSIDVLVWTSVSILVQHCWFSHYFFVSFYLIHNSDHAAVCWALSLGLAVRRLIAQEFDRCTWFGWIVLVIVMPLHIVDICWPTLRINLTFMAAFSTAVLWLMWTESLLRSGGPSTVPSVNAWQLHSLGTAQATLLHEILLTISPQIPFVLSEYTNITYRALSVWNPLYGA